MTPSKRRQKLSAQTSTAQKVFEMMPEDRFVTVTDIMAHMHRETSMRLEPQVLKACVGALYEAKLLRRDGSDHFQRIPIEGVKPKEAPALQEEPIVTLPKKEAMTNIPRSTIRSRRPAETLTTTRSASGGYMTEIPSPAVAGIMAVTPPAAAPAPAPAQEEPTPAAATLPVRRSAVDLVGGIASTLRELADQLDDAAVVIDAAAESDQANLKKLGALRDAINQLKLD